MALNININKCYNANAKSKDKLNDNVNNKRENQIFINDNLAKKKNCFNVYCVELT